jgi:hypothetical protein
LLHPSFDGAEWVFHGLSSNAHNVRLLVQTLLHGIDDGFVFPPFDATLPTGRALRFHRAARAVAGPIVAQGQPVLDVVEPPGQPLPGWAAILVVFDDADLGYFKGEEILACDQAGSPLMCQSR